MLLPALTLAAALAAQQAALQRPDSIVIPSGDMMRLYTDCGEARWPYGTGEQLIPKTRGELDSGIVRRTALEAAWSAWFIAQAGDSIPLTPKSEWHFPLEAPGRLLNNYRSPRPGGIHAALDIFVPEEGVLVRSPVSGVVVGVGDGWRGGYEQGGRGFYYEGDGLSRRAGNAVILFEPGNGGYVLFSHMQEGILVRAGDVIAAGTPIGRVGHTGNAIRPGRGKHLHIAYKEPGRGCGVDGVLVPLNPYRFVRAARDREYPRLAAPAPRPARASGRAPSRP